VFQRIALAALLTGIFCGCIERKEVPDNRSTSRRREEALLQGDSLENFVGCARSPHTSFSGVR